MRCLASADPAALSKRSRSLRAVALPLPSPVVRAAREWTNGRLRAGNVNPAEGLVICLQCVFVASGQRARPQEAITVRTRLCDQGSTLGLGPAACAASSLSHGPGR